MSPLLLALLGTGFTFAATALGAAMVFFFKKDIPEKTNRAFLGFAAGVMIAAAIFSLILPSMEMAKAQWSALPWLPAAVGFALGVLFLLALDELLPHLHPGSTEAEGPKARLKRTTLLVFAVTLHNIPEGLSVGLAFGLAGDAAGMPLSGAIALAIGMALQNFPEGAAVALPLKNEGASNRKAFLLGSLSGLVEPISGVIGVLLAQGVSTLMPWLLAFAAGAMLYVVVEELIPEAHLGEHSNVGTISVMFGFLLMMVLDVALG